MLRCLKASLNLLKKRTITFSLHENTNLFVCTIPSKDSTFGDHFTLIIKGIIKVFLLNLEHLSLLIGRKTKFYWKPRINLHKITFMSGTARILLQSNRVNISAGKTMRRADVDTKPYNSALNTT